MINILFCVPTTQRHFILCHHSFGSLLPHHQLPHGSSLRWDFLAPSALCCLCICSPLMGALLPTVKTAGLYVTKKKTRKLQHFSGKRRQILPPNAAFTSKHNALFTSQYNPVLKVLHRRGRTSRGTGTMETIHGLQGEKKTHCSWAENILMFM